MQNEKGAMIGQTVVLKVQKVKGNIDPLTVVAKLEKDEKDKNIPSDLYLGIREDGSRVRFFADEVNIITADGVNA